MDILEKILAHKRAEVNERKQLYPVKLLEKSMFFESKPVSLKKYIQREDKQGIIAEYKRRSPSKGVINNVDSVERVSIWYMQAGASALSILTDAEFFGGSLEDIQIARKFNYCPILRKDFIIDEYQIVEAKSIGADAVLLIAAALEKSRIEELASLAKSFGMEVLFEVHGRDELSGITQDIDLVGVNNRNLKTFEVSIEQSLQLVEHIPNEMVKVSESGIRTPEDVVILQEAGFQGFLIGEKFMSSARPGKACSIFIEGVKELKHSKAK